MSILFFWLLFTLRAIEAIAKDSARSKNYATGGRDYPASAATVGLVKIKALHSHCNQCKKTETTCHATFLIDSDSDYMLTARHCVSGIEKNDQDFELKILSIYQHNTKPSCSIVAPFIKHAGLKGSDLALISYRRDHQHACYPKIKPTQVEQLSASMNANNPYMLYFDANTKSMKKIIFPISHISDQTALKLVLDTQKLAISFCEGASGLPLFQNSTAGSRQVLAVLSSTTANLENSCTERNDNAELFFDKVFYRCKT